ncbi:transcription termination/antitermination protein NusG [Methylobacterium sp. J-092]|uniref:transcription termination/antitermination protein NusG n=1 Tax=Methylobacterium sp. J-092 TaxID=2836667 RepID=UPI001FB8E8A7|nr:antitermination protein NusG [Methylobacterium sp. J-092]MCJ2009793.1 antitermination protein NusG [Methylobacterium sp. J-092]
MARSQKQRLREQRRREEARNAEARARQRRANGFNEKPKPPPRPERAERFIVDPTRKWHVVRTLPRWSGRAAEQIRGVGVPVFEAREAVRLVSEIGKARTALVPLLRRLLFVGINDWQELAHVESHPGIYDDATTYRRGGLAMHDGRPIVIAPDEMQTFADCVTGWDGDISKAAKILFDIGEAVRVTVGQFASFDGRVEAVDQARERLTVAVAIFGRETPVELEYAQVERA